jgi:hypothetical protein
LTLAVSFSFMKIKKWPIVRSGKRDSNWFLRKFLTFWTNNLQLWSSTQVKQFISWKINWKFSIKSKLPSSNSKITKSSRYRMPKISFRLYLWIGWLKFTIKSIKFWCKLYITTFIWSFICNRWGTSFCVVKET